VGNARFSTRWFKPTPKPVKDRPWPVIVMQKILIYVGLIFLGFVSFLFPPVGLPIGILMFHTTKKHYALFPLAGVLFLVFFTLFNNLAILISS